MEVSTATVIDWSATHSQNLPSRSLCVRTDRSDLVRLMCILASSWLTCSFRSITSSRLCLSASNFSFTSWSMMARCSASMASSSRISRSWCSSSLCAHSCCITSVWWQSFSRTTFSSSSHCSRSLSYSARRRASWCMSWRLRADAFTDSSRFACQSASSCAIPSECWLLSSPVKLDTASSLACAWHARSHARFSSSRLVSSSFSLSLWRRSCSRWWANSRDRFSWWPLASSSLTYTMCWSWSMPLDCSTVSTRERLESSC
mmetsp:Transcript_3129/g.5368  ORF Transcript_3129/g.5368 Transcript_3129/m.5368 type:complete len:260 (-) Transcript_3129:521-1300(-)